MQGGWVSRKDASHNVGFIVRAAGVSLFSPLSPSLRPLGWAHTCPGCPGEASLFSPGPGWPGRVHTNRVRGGQVISAQSYCHLQYLEFFPLKQNQIPAKIKAFW